MNRRGFLGGLLAAACSSMLRFYPAPLAPAPVRAFEGIPVRMTLADWAKTRDPNGSTQKVAEIFVHSDSLLLREMDEALSQIQPFRPGEKAYFLRVQ